MRSVHSLPILSVVLSTILLLDVRATIGEETTRGPTVRDVTPPGTTRVFRSEKAGPIPDRDPPYVDIHVLPSGILRSESRTIRLYGVALPERKRICAAPPGTRWACGNRAFVALRNLVEAKTLNCNVKQASEANLIAVCRIGRTDVSAWLLQEGWAELAVGVTDKQYVEAVATAKTKGAGIWGSGPPTTR
jgi:endonuclease YncB( thermonuclease family)